MGTLATATSGIAALLGPTSAQAAVSDVLTDTEIASTYVPKYFSGGTNERIAYRDGPTYDKDFTFKGIYDNADGAFVWRQMQVSAGYGGRLGDGQPISYFKAIGGSINHTGAGNIDAVWISLQHRGPREAGLFIGDVTSRAGGNVYGGHTRVTVAPDPGFGAPAFQASWSHELFVGAKRGPGQTAYGELIDIQGSFAASAAIHIGAPLHTGDRLSPETSPVIHGINMDASLASRSATALMIGGAWGSGINMNANSIIQAGSISGVGAAPNRDVRVADNLLLDNARFIKFKASNNEVRRTMGVTGTDNTRFIAVSADSQWEFYDAREVSLLARITSSGRADFSKGGITTRVSTGSSQPSFLAEGHVEIWQDASRSMSYLVVHVNGQCKKVPLK